MKKETQVLVAGVFNDLILMHVPLTTFIILCGDKQKDEETFKTSLEDVYMEMIHSELFKNCLKCDIIISYGDVIHELITEKRPMAKRCGINDHYCLVFSVDFYRPYIWSDNYHCKKQLANWNNIYFGSIHTHKEQLLIRNYKKTFGQMIRNGTKEEFVDDTGNNKD